ncbi:MAG: pantoate--beta-alanine ligase [Myxococcota bacterium]
MIAYSSSPTMAWWSSGRTGKIGLVPTMGFLHDGHISLMQRLRADVDHLIVSIFVNPLQFGPNEDLDRYPRDPEGDAAKCEAAGVDVLFSPTDFYPSDFSTTVSVARLTDRLCGASRPGHFDGVTTVVARLFGVTRCHVACFGEKDYQQLAVVRRMVRDLALPVEIIGAPLVRDADGLALSSRNKYLTPDDRQRALSLHRALFAMRDAAAAGEHGVSALLARGRSVLQADREDYLEIVDAESLEPLTELDRPARALVAAYVGSTRLIDNIAL